MEFTGKRGDRQQLNSYIKTKKVTNSGKGYRRNSRREQAGNLEMLP